MCKGLCRLPCASRSAYLTLICAAWLLAFPVVVFAQSAPAQPAAAKPPAVQPAVAQPPEAQTSTPHALPAVHKHERAADLIPDTAVGALTLEKAGVRLAQFRKHPFYQAILDSDLYRLLQADAGFNQAKFGVFGFSAAAGVDTWDLFETLLGDNLTIALEPGEGGKPVAWAVCVTDKPEAAAKLATALNQMSGLLKDGKPDETRSREVEGVRGYQINPEAYYAVFDNVIAMTNRPEALERTIRLRNASSGRLGDVDRFRQARSRTTTDALLWGYVNVDGLRQRFKDRWIPEKIPNGFVSMVFGGIIESARDADTASADLSLGRDGLSVNVFLHGKSPLPDTHKAFFVPAKDAADWSSLSLPGALAQVSLRRDFHELWTQRDKLVSAKGLSKLSEFAGNVSNLLGQMDFGDDFLAQTGCDLQFLSNLQRFEPGKTPMPQFPAFGMIVPLTDVKQFGQRLESATMMAFSFISMQAAQNDRNALLVDVDSYKGCKLICAKYPDAPADASPLPQRYNFSPTAAIVKDRFVLGSTPQFIKDVIDAAENLPTTAASGAARASSYMNVKADELTAILKANLEPLVAKKMLEENKTKSQAESEWNLLLKLLSSTEGLAISIDRAEEGLKATARLALKPGAIPQ